MLRSRNEARRAVERALERDRDAPLDLLGRLTREERDDLDLRVGRIGERLDREVRVGVVAEARDDRGEQERGEPIVERVAEQRVEHRDHR